MASCARCGGFQKQEMVDVTAFGDACPRFIPGWHHSCTVCGHMGAPVSFMPYAMPRPLTYLLNPPALGDWLQSDYGTRAITVHAGPPAHLPMPPDPDEILVAAGLAHLVTSDETIYGGAHLDDWDLDD